MLGQRVDAQQKMLDALSQSAPPAQAAFGVITRLLTQAGSHDAVVQWTESVLGLELAPEFHGLALGWQIKALLETDSPEILLAKIPMYLSLVKGDDATQILGHVLGAWAQKGDHERVDQALALIKSAVDDDPELAHFLFLEELKSLLARQQWDAAVSHFKGRAESISGELRQDACRIFNVEGTRAKLWAELDAFDDYILSAFAEESNLRDMVARHWVTCAVELRKYSELPERMTRLLDLGVHTRVLMPMFEKSLYAVMDGTQNEILKALLEIDEDIAALTLTDDEKARLSSLMFDAAFILEDYARVLAVLEQGIPKMDEAWHLMAKNKVLAHQALKNGDFKEAARQFRGFMAYVDSTWEGAKVDPSTGIQHSREMSLGYNAKRIAGILTQAGEMGQAQQTYAEALAYYTTAAAEVEPDSKEATLIQAEIQELRALVGPDEE